MKKAEERLYGVFKRKEIPAVIQSAEVSEEERLACPYVVTFALPYRAIPNGFPPDRELTRVARIEERIKRKLEPIGHVHVGHITGRGQMLVVFYCRSAIQGPVTVKSGLFSKITVIAECRRDDAWSFFEENMVMTDEEFHRARNAPLLRNLKKEGDIHTRPRTVDFFAVFPSEDARATFIAEISARGFSFTDEQVRTLDDGTAVIEFVKDTPIDEDTMAAICGELHELAFQAGGEFDGWATPMVKR